MSAQPTPGPRRSLRLISEVIRNSERGERINFEHLQEIRAAIRVDYADIADLLAAATTVLDDLNARIEESRGGSTPVFRGIADLHAAISKVTGSAEDDDTCLNRTMRHIARRQGYREHLMSGTPSPTVAIPIAAGKRIADEFGYDQVVIVARKVGGPEHVTTYGAGEAHCAVAARVGDFFKHKLMGWPAPAAPEPATDSLMELVQVFASAWSLVGGQFDDGSMIDDATYAKDEVRAAIRAALAAQVASEPSGAMLLIEKFGRAVTDMFEQLEKGNWRDDHDHDVRQNRQMQALRPLIVEAIALLRGMQQAMSAKEWGR